MSALKSLQLSVFSLLLAIMSDASAADIRVAVASNFSRPMQDVARLFEQKTGHRVVLVYGSTGKHYAQIINGAPFEAFFAADIERPQRLEQESVAQAGSRFTYAVGKLVLWSPDTDMVDPQGRVLNTGNFRFLALANPRLAPYGRAAEEIIRAQGARERLHGRMVRGENIGQAFQFVKSGNAELGFVSLSQIKQPGKPVEGSYWNVPQSLYSPIEQQAVVLQDNPIAHAFAEFVKSDRAREIIQAYGYGVP